MNYTAASGRGIENPPHMLNKSQGAGNCTQMRLNLTTTNLIDKFGDNIFSCFDIGSWKPEPEIYLHAAKQTGFQPGECAFIEYSIPGIQAAKVGGFDVFGFANNQNKETFIEMGVTAFYEIGELKQLFGID